MAELAAVDRTFILRSRLPRRDVRMRDEITGHQERTLHRLHAFACEGSPFYSRFHQGRERAPLGDLPVLTKAVLMNEFDALVADHTVRGADVEAYLKDPSGGARLHGRHVVSATAGTTGQPGIFLAASGQWVEVMASYTRATGWAGVSVAPSHHRRLAMGRPSAAEFHC